MIAVNVEQLLLSNLGFVMLLKAQTGELTVPIFIGAAEAQAIALHLNHVKIPRPLTHDLLKNVLDYLECRLKRVEISELQEGTFYARLCFERDEIEMTLDSRPSDAIALALRCGAPMYVSESVMAEAGRDLHELTQHHRESQEASGHAAHAEESKARSPLEQLEHRLSVAIKQEDYEQAARLRDEIQNLKNSHGDN